MSSFIADLLSRLAPRIGATVVYEPQFANSGYITFSNGKRVFFRDNRFDLNPLGSVKLAQDKAHSAHFLQHFGYNTPPYLTFWHPTTFPGSPVQRHIDHALSFAQNIGYPIYVKPNDRSQGQGVFCCHTPAELMEASRLVLDISRVALVQKAATGLDWRVVVLDGKVISAYQRIPLQITPDGTSTLRQLLQKLQSTFRTTGRDTTLKLKDSRLLANLARLGYSLDSIPPASPPAPPIKLHDVANLSLGGSCRDVTHILHPAIAALAARISHDFRLRISGIDLISPNITTQPIPPDCLSTLPPSFCTPSAPTQTPDYTVIELNSAPGLDHYAHPNPAVQQQVVDDLYMQLLLAVQNGPP